MIWRVVALLLLFVSPAFAFPTTSVLDTAIRADESPLANGWLGPVVTSHGQLQLLSNGITANVFGDRRSGYWSTSYGPGSEVYVKFKAIPSVDWRAFLYLRLNNPNTGTVSGYSVSVAMTGGVAEYTYFRLDNGAGVQLGSGTAGPALGAGDQFGAQMIGSQLIIFAKVGAGAWTAVDAGRTDTTYAGAGFLGIRSSDVALVYQDFGGGLSGFVDTTPPTVPSNLSTSATTSSTIALSWTGSTDDNTIPSYRAERALFSGGSCGAYTEIAQPAATNVVDSGLAAATAYCHRVRAFDGTNFSGYSNVTITTTLALRTIVLLWNDNSPNAQNVATESAFQLERCPNVGCSNFAVVATLGANVVTYTDTASPAPIAGYRVTAIPQGGGYSNIYYTSPAVPLAVLAVTPPLLTFASTVGTNPPTQSLTISNGGGAGMAWTVSDNVTWLSVAPASGTDNTILIVTVNQTGLAAGAHNATITVTAPGANGSPASIPVTLTLFPVSVPSTGSSGRIR